MKYGFSEEHIQESYVTHKNEISSISYTPSEKHLLFSTQEAY